MRDKPRLWRRIDGLSAAAGAAVALVAVAVSALLGAQQLREMRNDATIQIREMRDDTATQLREMRDEAKIQHLVDESNRFDSGSLLQSRKALAAKRIDLNTRTLRPLDPNDPPDEMWDMLNECDHVGLLTRHGYLDVADVWSEMGYWLLNIDADAKDVISNDQKDDPASMENCTWLIDQMMPIQNARSGGQRITTDRKSKDSSLFLFYFGEIEAEQGKSLPRGHGH